MIYVKYLIAIIMLGVCAVVDYYGEMLIRAGRDSIYVQITGLTTSLLEAFDSCQRKQICARTANHTEI